MADKYELDECELSREEEGVRERGSTDPFELTEAEKRTMVQNRGSDQSSWEILFCC
jgi:hypothetical protein